MFVAAAAQGISNGMNSIVRTQASKALARSVKGGVIGTVTGAIFGGPLGAIIGGLSGAVLNLVGGVKMINIGGDNLTALVQTATKSNNVIVQYFGKIVTRAIEGAVLGASTGVLGGIHTMVLGILGGLVLGALYGATDPLSGRITKGLSVGLRSATDYLMGVSKPVIQKKVFV